NTDDNIFDRSGSRIPWDPMISEPSVRPRRSYSHGKPGDRVGLWRRQCCARFFGRPALAHAALAKRPALYSITPAKPASAERRAYMICLPGVRDIEKKYPGGSKSASQTAQAVFAKVAEQAPQSAISSGLTEAFRSPSPPPFPEMVSHLFGHSD